MTQTVNSTVWRSTKRMRTLLLCSMNVCQCCKWSWSATVLSFAHTHTHTQNKLFFCCVIIFQLIDRCDSRSSSGCCCQLGKCGQSGREEWPKEKGKEKVKECLNNVQKVVLPILVNDTHQWLTISVTSLAHCVIEGLAVWVFLFNAGVCECTHCVKVWPRGRSFGGNFWLADKWWWWWGSAPHFAHLLDCCWCAQCQH